MQVKPQRSTGETTEGDAGKAAKSTGETAKEVQKNSQFKRKPSVIQNHL